VRKIYIYLCLLLFFSVPSYAIDNIKVFPNISGETFAGNKLNLPSDLKGKISFINLGFSKDSSKISELWVKEFIKKYSNDKNTDYYICPMLGDSFFMKNIGKMMESSVKKQTPVNAHNHVMIVYQSLEQIKKSINYSDDEKTYFYLLNKKGDIVWSDKGQFTNKKFNLLKEAMTKLITK